MECTEKILCFIAAGKWILTQAYLRDSLVNGKFLDEENYHVSKEFQTSKLALVSLKYFSRIIY